MKERKRSADWYIAATHYLTAGFAIPFIVGLVYAFTLLPFLIDIGSAFVTYVASLLLGILAIWFGVMYAARYLKRTYIIENPRRIVKLSVAYFVIIAGGFLLLGIFTGKLAGVNMGYEILDFIIQVGVFYGASVRYVVVAPASFSQ